MKTAPKTTKTPARSAAKEPTMKTTAKKSASKTPLPSIETVQTLAGDELVAAYERVLGESPKPRTPVPVMRKRVIAALKQPATAPAVEQALDDFAIAAGIQTAWAQAIVDVEEADAATMTDAPVRAPEPSDAPANAFDTVPAAEAPATRADATDAPADATAPLLGTCDRCGRTDVLARAEDGTLTLHDGPDGGACNLLVAAPPAPSTNPLDMVIARLRTMEPAAQRLMLEGFSKQELLPLVERVTGAKTSGRLAPATAVERILAALAAGPAAQPAFAVEPATDAAAAPPQSVDRPAPTSTTPAPATERQLPPVGTVLIKADRHGAERCRCTVVDGGVEYRGTVYKSLSAAAIAASRDLGNNTTQTNGWTFWGLTSGPRPATKKGLDLDLVARAFDRYRERVEAASKDASAEDKDRLQQLVGIHQAVVASMADAVRA